MSSLKNLFGTKNKTEKPPTPQEAIQKLLETEDILKKKSDFLETKIEEQFQIAKTNAAKNKKSTFLFFHRILFP